MSFDPVSFALGAASAKGGPGGASALSGLTDVDISNPTDGQTLVYNAATGKWENGAGGGGGYKVFEVTFMAVDYSYIFSAPCLGVAPNGATVLSINGEVGVDVPLTFQLISFSDVVNINANDFHVDLTYMPVCTGGVELTAEGFKVTGDGTITCKGIAGG